MQVFDDDDRDDQDANNEERNEDEGGGSQEQDGEPDWQDAGDDPVNSGMLGAVSIPDVYQAAWTGKLSPHAPTPRRTDTPLPDAFNPFDVTEQPTIAMEPLDPRDVPGVHPSMWNTARLTPTSPQPAQPHQQPQEPGQQAPSGNDAIPTGEPPKGSPRGGSWWFGDGDTPPPFATSFASPFATSKPSVPFASKPSRPSQPDLSAGYPSGYPSGYPAGYQQPYPQQPYEQPYRERVTPPLNMQVNMQVNHPVNYEVHPALIPPHEQPTTSVIRPVLRARRQEDADRNRWRAGAWPDDTRPESVYQMAQWRQLAIAPGEVDPRRIAYVNAMRYVQASHNNDPARMNGQTALYDIFYYGLGLTLRPLDTTQNPLLLALYVRRSAEVYMDWSVFTPETFRPEWRGHTHLADSGELLPNASVPQYAWVQARAAQLDQSMLARTILAWAIAQHLIQPTDAPLQMGFAPHTAYPTIARGEVRDRVEHTLIAMAALLAPSLRVRRWLLSHKFTPERVAGLPERRRRHLIAELAQVNNCPSLFVEASLVGPTTEGVWRDWDARLCDELAPLKRRRDVAQEHLLRKAQAERRSGGVASWPGVLLLL